MDRQPANVEILPWPVLPRVLPSCSETEALGLVEQFFYRPDTLPVTEPSVRVVLLVHAGKDIIRHTDIMHESNCQPSFT